MAKSHSNSNRKLNQNPPKKTSQGRGWLKTSSMNKNKKRSHKRYRGQG